MADPTETARRVLELSARAFDTRSLAYQQANEALAGAAEDLARALLESQAALAAAREERASAEAVALARHGTISALRADLAAANARADLAYEEKALADREFVASQKIVRELVGFLATARTYVDQPMFDDEEDADLLVEIDALIAKHAAPAPPPAAVPGLVFGPTYVSCGEPRRDGVASDGCAYWVIQVMETRPDDDDPGPWFWGNVDGEAGSCDTEAEAIAVAAAQNAARLKGGE